MKTLPCRFASAVLGCSLLWLANPPARATIIVDSSESFGSVTISPGSGSLNYLGGGVQSAAYAQAGGNAQYASGPVSVAGSTDVPVPGGLATAAGTASTSPLAGSSSATGSIPGATAGFDTSAGIAWANSEFDITGVTGPVSVTFSTVINAQLALCSDAYGVMGEGETVFSLEVNGNPVLFNNQLLSIGPDQSLNTSYSEPLTNTMTLTAGTPYWLWVEGDAEAMVVNSSAAAVPDPAVGAWPAGCLWLSLLVISLVRRRWVRPAGSGRGWLLLGVALAGVVLPAGAMFIGSDPPDVCQTCGAQPTRRPGGGANTSLTEGNLRVDYPVVNIKSGYGPTLPFSVSYNSDNADGSKAQLNTVMGYGWTHTYNVFLFNQLGAMFRYDDTGRVIKYNMNYSGSGGTYVSDTGYFETLTTQPDGSFIVTNKYQSWWHFGLVPNTPFLVAGPVYQLLQTGDRNQNTNTLSYNANGLLATVTDPYGRTLQFTYDAGNKLSSVTDPLGRTTTFQYDPLDRVPIQITDPMGNTTQYTYNSLYQMTRELDRDGRMFFYTYKDLRPFMVTDGGGQPYFSMSNPGNWAVNQTTLAESQRRQYVPGTTTLTDGNGHVWQYAYDTNGSLTQVTAPDSTTTRYTYDPGTREIASMTDANGHTTRYQYDPAGNRLSLTDALGNVTTWTYDPVFNEPTSMTDPNGRITQWQYDPHGNQIKEIDPLGQTETWTYDSHGNVLSATDKRGYTTTNQYDPNGNLILESDAVGTPVQRTMEYTYDADGNRITMTDALGRVTQYQYDGLNRLTQETDAVGTPIQRTTETTYDGDGDRISMTDALGRVTQYQFDARNRMIQETDAVGTPVQRTTETTYDGDDNRISTTDALGRVTQYQYDGLNRRIQETDAVGTPQQRSSTTTYDGVGNVITTTDANGHTATNGYDALNRRISMTDPLGNTTVYEYANLGGMSCCGASGGSDLLTGMIDANGKATYYHYDELNRPIQTVRKSGGTNDTVTPADAVTTTTYDPDNNRIAVTDANGNTTAYTYDALDRQSGMTNAAGDVSTTAYDTVGNVLQTTDPRGDVTTTVYDALNRPIQVTDSLGPVSTTAYDPVGNVISTTDANGNITSTTYDALNRHTSMTDPLGHPTTTTYDSVGNVLSTTDRNGNTTTWMYDPLDRQTSMTDALGDVSTTTYDPVGNRISTTDPLGHTMQYFYDADNRLIRETYPDTPADTRTYTYDGAGNRISMLDQNGRTTSYQYNDFYYLTNRQYSVGPNDQFTYDLGGRTTNAVRNGWTNDFTYDGADRVLTSIQNGRTVMYSYVIPSGFRIITYPSGTNVTEAYDLRSRLIQVNDGGSPALTQYTYDADNNVLSRTNRNGTAARQTYNANNWVTSLTQTNADSLITGHAYVYDYEGNRLSQMNQVVSSNSETYGYDALNRLTNFDVGVLSGGIIPSPATAESYTLDPVGNWSTLVSNSVPQTRTHSAANELLTLNGSPLMYDANGNLTNDGRYAYTYDVQNRVTTVTRDSDTALVGQYFYDALGRRTTAVASPDGVATTNVLFYDGSRIIEEQNAGGTTLATYTYGNYVDEVLTMARGGETYYYHPDARFDVEAVTGSGGAVVERYTYDAYGGPVILDGTDNPLPLNSWGTPHSAITNEFLFTGRELDEESGLYYFRARHYDAGQGRFLQRDPLGADAGVNQYAYVVDNPENHADAFGLAPDDSLPANWILGKAMNGKEYLWEWVSREPRTSSETVLLRDTDLSGPNGAWCRYVTLNYSYNIVKFRVYQPPTEKEWEQPPETIMRRARKVADITLWDSLSFSVGPKGAPFRCGPSCGAARGTLSAAGGVYLTHAWPGAGAYATPNIPAGLVPSWWTSAPVRQPPGPPMAAFSEAAPTGTEGTGGYMPQMFGD